MTPRPPRHAPRFWRLTAGAQHGTLTVKSEGRVVGAHAQPVPPRGGHPGRRARSEPALTGHLPSHRGRGTPGPREEPSVTGAESKGHSPLAESRARGRPERDMEAASTESGLQDRSWSIVLILVCGTGPSLEYRSQSGVSILTCSIDPCLRDRSRAVALICSAGTCGSHTGDHAPGYLAGRDGVLHRP